MNSRLSVLKKWGGRNVGAAVVPMHISDSFTSFSSPFCYAIKFNMALLGIECNSVKKKGIECNWLIGSQTNSHPSLRDTYLP